MLDVRDMRFSYEEYALEANFSVARGECLAIMGPSGVGKSTLFDLIAGFLAPERGRIEFDGASLLDLKPAERPLTILFQEHNLFAHLNARRNVAVGLHPGLKLRPEAWSQVDTALAAVGLAGFENRLPADLSGGQRQRVAIARALARRRPLLLLDEPFNALDKALRLELLTQVRELMVDHRLCVLLATHHDEEVATLAERVLTLNADARGIARAACATRWQCAKPLRTPSS